METHTSAPAPSSATVEARRGGVPRDLPVDEAARTGWSVICTVPCPT